jgi:hypothetical protein
LKAGENLHKRILVSFLIVTLLVVSDGCNRQNQKSLVMNKAVKYTLYIGLNDQDGYKQTFDTETAKEKISNICLKYVDGYTVAYGEGAYKDEKEIITKENSLIYSFYFASEEQIKAIMDEILKELNQNAILVEKNDVNYEFYEGAEP